MQGTKRETEAEARFMFWVLDQASVLITALLGTFSSRAEASLALAAEGFSNKGEQPRFADAA